MSLAITQKGDLLLKYQIGTELDIPTEEQSIPMPFTLIVARHQGKTIFVYNRGRQEWELPGGMIDPGETSHSAAVRELAEETGQHSSSLVYAGWVKFSLKPDKFHTERVDRIEHGVIYKGELDTIRPFTPNDEIADMMLWDLQSPVEGYVNGIDLYLAQHTK